MPSKLLPLLAVGLFLSSLPPAIAACKISQSVYRDVNGRGFELVFGPGLPDLVGRYATATIRGSSQNQLYRFGVTQANGYGSITLLFPSEPDREGFRINFFDTNLKSATPIVLGEEASSPKYAFITDLGSYDYYHRRSQVSSITPPLIGDTLWVFDRCQ